MKRTMLNSKMQLEEFSDGEIIIYDTENEIVHILNNSAATVLQLITNNQSMDCENLYIKKIKSEYGDIDESVLRNDYKKACIDIVSKDIVTNV